tara:strand:+ start:258 stop:536 length:279 start_codon:yes stop_codon:yes gene_type:complete
MLSLIEDIKNLIKIVDLRSEDLSYDEKEKIYEEYWCGSKDDCFHVNELHKTFDRMLNDKEIDEFSTWCLRATPEETLNYIENYIQQKEHTNG